MSLFFLERPKVVEGRSVGEGITHFFKIKSSPSWTEPVLSSRLTKLWRRAERIFRNVVSREKPRSSTCLVPSFAILDTKRPKAKIKP